VSYQQPARANCRTLKEFVYVDEAGKDVGANVRQKAKDITNLLQDDDRLRSERKSRGAMRDRMLGNLATSGLQGDRDFGDRHDTPNRPPPRRGNEDDDLQKAIAESMRMQEEEAKRRSQVTQEEDDLQRALRLSEEEEAKRKRDLESANQNALFDDSLNM
jgi:epsin